ncbi:MAG TPA: prolyl oligopeptidase family serine peptidase [Urbifossiella sp.]|jgi:hypothetical protein|nr:prolyl oligopeptidase family serine peptidase [Urbifossiella sp.]
MLSRALLPLLAIGVIVAPIRAADPPAIAPFFRPPAALEKDLGTYRSPLLFDDGSPVRTPVDWRKRRGEISTYWHGQMGVWPAIIERPKLEYREKERRENITQHRVKIETAPGRIVDDAFLLVPDGKGPFPAVVVVFYEASTGIGRGKGPLRDFAWQLARRGFVTLSVGGDPNTYYPTRETCRIQPLSFHAYEAANCYQILASLPFVDPARIGITGHSYGGKWAMFAACLFDKFAAGAWSDPGIVFDESRSNVNYWEPWYLGFDLGKEPRPRGIPNDKNPRTGPYKQMMAAGRDLHELHALMAPRPFLASGGAEDPAARWKALNHSVAVNRLLGFENRVALTTRPTHDPTEESNAALYTFFEWSLGPTAAR